MSAIKVEDTSDKEEIFSNRPNYELLSQQANLNESNSNDMCHRISNLQDIRYDATYKISQFKQKILDIEKEELAIMKESTIKHSNLQENYIPNLEEENFVKKLAGESAVRLGTMKFELKMINEQVQLEQKKLEEIESKSEMFSKKIEESTDEEKKDLLIQFSIIEEQKDQQAKIFEDLEFKELETQSRFEEESETLKSNIIEAQRKLIMSTRNRENRKLYYDEQQILLMKKTRKNLDKLENERNQCHKQITHYQTILNTCSTQIEEFNRQTSSGFLDQTLLKPDKENNVEINFMERFGSNPQDESAQNTLIGPSYSHNSICTANNSLQEKLESLTEIVKLNLKISVNSEENINNGCVTGPYLSNLSLSDDAESLLKHDNAFSTDRSNKPTIVTFDCISTEESTSSNHSPCLDPQTKSSRSDLNSETSNNDENFQNDTQIKSILRRKNGKHASKRAKQSRPLTCFLPKLHSDFNLLKHIETCGHDLTICGNHIQIDQHSCQGFLWKLSKRLFGVWKKQWFYFDHRERQLKYYNSKSKSKIKGFIEFQYISDVFVDHTHRARNPQKLTLCIETQEKSYYLIAAKPELVTLWVDVIFTGAEAYLTLHHPYMLNNITQGAE